MTDKSDNEILKLLNSGDGNVTIDAAELAKSSLARKRRRDQSNARLTVTGCLVGFAMASVYFFSSPKVGDDAESIVHVVYLDESKDIDQLFDSKTIELELLPYDNDVQTRKIANLKEKITRLKTERNRQQAALIREKLSRTELVISEIEFPGI